METEQKTSIFGPYEDLDMLSWMRSTALDPCHSSPENLQKMRKQILNVRKFMILSSAKAPQRKRKLDLFLKGKSPSSGSRNQHRISEMKTSDPLPSFDSSVSCVIDSVDLHGNVHQTPGSSGTSPVCKEAFDRNLELSCVLNTHDVDVPDSDITPFMESRESAVSPKHVDPTVEYHEPVHGSSTTDITDELIPKHVVPTAEYHEPVRDSSTTDITDELINNDNYLERPQRNTRLHKFVGDSVPTVVVPVGPRFQADIPEWTGPLERRTIRNDARDSETLKWLGVRIWPIKARNSESRHKQVIGKGREDSCSCISPRSADCIKRHILEERRVLKINLGSAFYSWKFDDMGEEVAKSWSALEQETFKGLMKAVASSDGNGFWNNVSKFFPAKRRETIISYYFNVYIPRGITTRPQWLLDQVDAQVDESAGTAKTYMQQKNKSRKSKRR